ncbi:MAG: hypothetical protein OSJ69_21815 [Acetatifactor sp.]|nr:hypothetical protein [Acetatifactor sp.]
MGIDEKTAGEHPAVFSSAEGSGQLSLFPSAEEQVEKIAQVQAEEKREAPAPGQHVKYLPEGLDRCLNSALAGGGNESDSILRIVAFYQKGPDNKQAAAFLEKEFGVGGKGILVDGVKVSVWFGKDGLFFARGNSALVPGAVLVPWERAAARVRKLLDRGTFAAQDKLDGARDHEYQRQAESMWYLAQSLSDEAREKGYLPYLRELYGGFPDSTERIAELLREPGYRHVFCAELDTFIQALQKNPELLRYRRYHPERVRKEIDSLDISPRQFHCAEGFVPVKGSFVTEDEIDQMLRRGSGVSEGKLRIYSYFMQGHDAKECAAFLRNEYGDGGWGQTGYDEWHDSKGIKFTREDDYSGYKGYDTVFFNWNQVQERIRRLIRDGKYLNVKEKEYLPEYEKIRLARELYNFRQLTPDRPGNDRNALWDIEKGAAEFRPVLDSPKYSAELYEDMVKTFAPLLPEDVRGYETMKKALEDMAAFVRGEYSLFKPLPASVLEAERDGIRRRKEAEKEEKRQERQAAEKFRDTADGKLGEEKLQSGPAGKQASEMPKAHQQEGELEKAARALAKKQRAKAGTRQEMDGQLSLDFYAMGAFGADNGETARQTETRPVPEKDNIRQEEAQAAEGQAAEEQAEKRTDPRLNPHAEEYLAVKALHPDKLIAVQVGGLCLFYGKDAEAAAPVLGAKLLRREIDGLGETFVTGTKSWQGAVEKALEHGHSILVIGPEPGKGADAPYVTIKERSAADYIPLGMQLVIDGRRMMIDSVDFGRGKVSLKDLRVQGWFPVFREESVSYVRECIEREADREAEASVEAVVEAAEKAGETAKTDTADLEEAKREERSVPESGQETEKPAAPQEQLVPSDTVQVFDVGLPFEVAVQKLVTEEEREKERRLQERRDYRITDDNLGAWGQKTRYQNNAAAVRTLKQIEAEGRNATGEEQEILAKYTGWGGLSQAFDPANEKWGKEYAELSGLLTPEEYESARATVLNAFYTSPLVVKAVYAALGRMEFVPGNILEPSCGAGNFLGLVPEGFAGAKLYGVELDSLTGRIASQLYQKADITIGGFETTDYPDSFFDLALGNVPFGDYKVHDRKYDRLNLNIHDYFLVKALDKVRPGGVMAFVTSKGTMDKADGRAREALAQKADLLGAIRLPNNAFKANADTDVTSDILFFQKRGSAPEKLPDWVAVGETEDGVPLNSYYLQHPEMVLGKMSFWRNMYGNETETACLPTEGADLAGQLSEAATRIGQPDRALLDMDAPEPSESGRTGKAAVESIAADPDVRNFSFTARDGKLYYRENSRMTLVEPGKKRAERIRDMIGIRDSARRLIEIQTAGASDSEVREEQARLNALYDSFVKKHGLLNSTGNRQAFRQDSSYPLLCSLEILDEEGKFQAKADIFTKRTIRHRQPVTHADTAVEALGVSIGERACVDLGFMASLMGGPEKIPQIVSDLKGIIFKDPDTGPFDMKGEAALWNKGWQTQDAYLSGNVREKLEKARKAAGEYPEFAVNVEALEAVQPKDLTAPEINARIGAPWVDKKYYNEFLYGLLKTPQKLRGTQIEVLYSDVAGAWNVTGKWADSMDNTRAYGTYGTKRVNAYEIFEDSLNQRSVEVYDTVEVDGKEKRVLNAKETAIAQQKQEAMKEAFREWIFKDPERRADLCATYNRLFNSVRPREYDGQHIQFAGMNPEIALEKHQRNAVARVLYGGNTLLAHVVGAGKTYECIAAAMEGKRLGLCRKSMMVVPNHLTEQWGSDFLTLYPGAKVLVATKKDFEPKNRRKFCARIATGDYDAVIIGHTQFEKIPISPERQVAHLQEQIGEIINGIGTAKDEKQERWTIRQMERTKKSLEGKLQRLMDKKRDDTVYFEELGVDRLFVDEAQYYKNLYTYTKMRNVAGIGQADAQKSSDMYAKCQYMDDVICCEL